MFKHYGSFHHVTFHHWTNSNASILKRKKIKHKFNENSAKTNDGDIRKKERCFDAKDVQKEEPFITWPLPPLSSVTMASTATTMIITQNVFRT